MMCSAGCFEGASWEPTDEDECPQIRHDVGTLVLTAPTTSGGAFRQHCRL